VNQHIISINRAILFALLLQNCTYALNSQEIKGPNLIIQKFNESLLSSKNQGEDTLAVYSYYIKKLIDRGNYLQVDSITAANLNGFEAIEDLKTLSEIYEQKAYMYKVQKRYAKSLEYYLWLKAHFESENDIPNLAKTYILLAEYYRAIGDFELCIKHLNDAEQLFNQFEPANELMANWYSRKAAWSNESTRDLDSVKFYANEGLKWVIETDNFHTHALLLNELGFAAMNSQMKGEVILDYFNRSKDLLFENERYRDYVEVINNMGIYQYRYGSKEIAIQLFEGILKTEEDNNWFGPLQVTYEYLTGIYRDLGQKGKSSEMREKGLVAEIKNVQAVNEINVNDLALSYEKDIAEKELIVQEQKTKVAETRARSNRRAFFIALSVAILLLVIAIITFQVNIRFRRKNDLLSSQREEIQNTNIQLEKSLGRQRLLFKELNHRVKNNLSILTALIYLQEVDENNDEFKGTLLSLRNRIKSMSLAHENLYNSEETEKIDFERYLKQLILELQNALTESNKITTNISCNGLVLGLQKAVPLAMIINELFTNSIKHGFPRDFDGIISVDAYNIEGDALIEYKDNGVGFSNEKKSKRTLGLRLVHLLLEQLDGTFEDKSKGSGVHFILKIPSLEDEN